MIRTTKVLLATSLVVFVGLIFSVTSFAATAYMYVDVNGNLRTVVANSATQAIAEAPNRHPNSGVIVASEMSGSLAIGGEGSFENEAAAGERAYVYVDVFGNLRTIYATTAAEAIAEAPNRHPNSGVIIGSNIDT